MSIATETEHDTNQTNTTFFDQILYLNDFYKLNLAKTCPRPCSEIFDEK